MNIDDIMNIERHQKSISNSNITQNLCDFSDTELHFTEIHEKVAVSVSLERYLVGFLGCLHETHYIQKSNLKGQISNRTQKLTRSTMMNCKVWTTNILRQQYLQT